ncbi:hypothetical protein OAS39_07895 [Pirellulales bacterium]|nr:hypothetical protein [Pirellulales bacterium]
MSGTTRTKLQLKPEEDHLLRILYKQFGITTDNFPRVPDKLEEFTNTFNGLTGRSDTAPEILHYMITRRKKSNWVKLGRQKQADLEQSPSYQFTKDDWRHIDAIYEEFQIPSDNFSLDPELSKKLQDEFARRSGRIIPALVISAAMVTRRKAGKLATLKPKTTERDLGFADIDELTG